MKRTLSLGFLALLVLLCVRVILPYSKVFTVEGVNFQETDAWYHIRLAEAFLQRFPGVASEDFHGGFPQPQRVDVGPVFDLGLVLLAKLVPGVELHTLAAFYPVLLGALAACLSWFLARRLWGETAAWWSLAFLLTLPGAATRVGSLGFTDHHVLEMLLYVGLLWALAGQRQLLAGLFLGLYLVTFVGGAVLVVFLIAWRLLVPGIPALWRLYAVALAIILPCRAQLWMEFSIASLAGAFALEAVWHFVPRARLRWALVAAASVVALWAAWRWGVLDLGRHFSQGIGSRTVGEMQPMTLRTTWAEYGGLALLGLAGAFLALREGSATAKLVAWTGLAFSAMALLQTRLNYYVALNLALLSGGTWVYLQQGFKTARERSIGLLFLILLVFAPNLWQIWDNNRFDTGLRADFFEVLRWMRTQTPDPFGDPSLYYRIGEKPAQKGYGVLAWWDYGYALTAIAHRVPYTNPTQRNAAETAKLLLASNERELQEGMRRNGLRYLMVSDDLPMMPGRNGVAGRFARIAAWAGRDQGEYYSVVQVREPSGSLRLATIYYPEYFQSALVRLTAFGGKAVEGAPQNCSYVELAAPAKSRYPIVTWKSPAITAGHEGAKLVSVSPLEPCLALDAWPNFALVKDSGMFSGLTESGRIKSVQLYELRSDSGGPTREARP
jgi:asparagine N-glycosylation enzyme membrane subunit Stt3